MPKVVLNPLPAPLVLLPDADISAAFVPTEVADGETFVVHGQMAYGYPIRNDGLIDFRDGMLVRV